tara:strand:- start:3840 stop:5366 length:1527 start_codon:yes stop_codon:yes gene_type:complete
MASEAVDLSDLSKIYNYEYGKSAIVGNELNISKLRLWLDLVVKKESGVANSMLLTGHSGIGKSHCIERFCNEYGFCVKMTYALDSRNRSFYENIFKERVNTEMSIVDGRYSIKKKRVILVFDEIDSDTSINGVIDYLKSVKKVGWDKKIPIIFIGNNEYDSKFSPLCPKFCDHIHFEKLTNTQMRVVYNRISCGIIKKKYFKRYNFPDSNDGENLIKEANGDVRYMMNMMSLNKRYVPLQKRGRKKKGSNESSGIGLVGVVACYEKEENYNLWEIYDKLVNEDLSIDSLIRISGMEGNWIVNGMYENYLEMTYVDYGSNKDCKGDVCIDSIHTVSDIMDNMSTANTIETMTINYNNLSTIQNYVRCISLYTINLKIKGCGRLNTSKFKFPSYFGKMSNNKITEISVNTIMNTLRGPYSCSNTKVRGDCIYPYYYRYIVVEELLIKGCISCVENYEIDLCEFERLLILYGITVEDFFTLLRPHVFGMIDLRKCISIQTKKLLRDYFKEF